MEKEPSIQEQVRARYAEEARRVRRGGQAVCCGSQESPSCTIPSKLYQAGEIEGLPGAALAASLGCGNPFALAQLQPGETVLDLGSGGGIDVLLSARRVGPLGKAYGLDMTDEMVALARENQQKASIANAEFLKGRIENIPLPDNSIDVILSNCVINLSGDKDQVFAETFRVLKPGGRIAFSDIVLRGELPSSLRKITDLWMGCVAGALEESEYRAKLTVAGFVAIGIEPTRIYTASEAAEFLRTLRTARLDPESLAPLLEGKFLSAFIRAHKPAR